MCGIFGILSTPSVDPSPRAVEDYLRDLSRLLRFRGDSLTSAAIEDAQRTLRSVTEKSYLLVGRSGLLACLADPALGERLVASLTEVREWVEGLEALVGRGAFRSQQTGELANALIVGGRDIHWRIERDVLGSIEPVRQLVGGGDGQPAVLARGWALNLILDNLDRLEVRGRDSAGLAAYVRFPSPEALRSFLDRLPGGAAAEAAARSGIRAFSHGALVRPAASDLALLFAFKVAEEVGEMGSNVRFLRDAIARDPVFQAAIRVPDVDVQAIAHTRWASNGVVSLPNCHPVDSTIFRSGEPVPGSAGSMVAVLNGDVDNYQDLYARYIREPGLEIDPEITTDAKIIPIVVGHHYRRSGDLAAAFRMAVDEFEGSMAIGIMAADRPGEFLFAQKGSGQGLFIGLAGDSVAVASEMYGVVELTPRCVKAEGERTADGEMFRIARGGGEVAVSLVGPGGERPIPAGRIRVAEITTRDINRGDFPRFLLKEISESVESARKTLRGKFELDGSGIPRFFLGPEVLDPDRLARLREGAIRRIIAIGQGTAAIAAEGAIHLLRRALARAGRSIEMAAMKATELSGHGLRDDMSDTLVIAVSQSGTTTDTNRTVDLLKERGAWVISIVNRRNSDLVYKSHGVLYTSDGRDIEMSVASTKAFYAQNVAGQVLALALAEALDTMPAEELAREAAALLALPDAMAATLALGPAVRELAERHALRKTYWAVVGSGAGKIAADEVRIKLSELCYKSIASDFLEDKKHIDLSSEPLVLVLAAGASPATISDCVKEVSIFKAHRSVPIVVADPGEARFDPYAAGVIHVPAHDGALAYLLATMVGHLFGYHAAAAFDRHADLLRAIRARIIRDLVPRSRASISTPEMSRSLPPSVQSDHGPAAEAGGPATLDLLALPEELVADIARFQELIDGGALDSGLRTGTAVRLTAAFQFLLGRVSLDAFARRVGTPATAAGILDTVVGNLTAGIDELARPIDAIKHQAKTVTVGISRSEERRVEGALWSLIRSLGLPVADLAESHKAFLDALEPVVARVEGATLYRLAGLDAVGRPRPGSTIRAVRRLGAASSIATRCEEDRPLAGTKWGVAKSRDIYLGYGQNDGRKILILPVIGERPEGSMLLFHIELAAASSPAERLRALRAHPSLLERLQIAVTERNQKWAPSLIEGVDNESLFLRPPEQVAEEIVGRLASA